MYARLPYDPPRDFMDQTTLCLLTGDVQVNNVLAKIAMEPSGGSSQQFAEFLKGDRETYARLIRTAGIKPE